MIDVHFVFPNGRHVHDEMPADMVPRIGETVFDDNNSRTWKVENVSRTMKNDRLLRRAIVRLKEVKG